MILSDSDRAKGVTIEVASPLDRVVPPSAERVIDQARELFAALGMPCQDESTWDTPRRFVKAMRELTRGMTVDPKRHLSVTFPPPGGDPALVCMTEIPFTSICEHHLLPFAGHADLAYLPARGARVVGLSKLARVVHDFAARPQIQERLGAEIIEALESCLDTQGVACVIRSTHMCTTSRGARSLSSEMVTTHLSGVFRSDSDLRSDFMASVRAFHPNPPR